MAIRAYAHQGGALEGPSSTLKAIEDAIKNGATAIELDVHATLDRKLVVCHDSSVDRTTNSKGAISSFTLKELKKLDNAYWFVKGKGSVVDADESEYVLRGKAPQDNDYTIATLAEVLLSFPGVMLNLDIKQTSPSVHPYEDILASELREFNRRDDVIVASFLDKATESFKLLAPEIPISAGTEATAEFYRCVKNSSLPSKIDYVALQVPHYFGDIEVVTKDFVEAAHSAELEVHVWTIDDAEEMENLIEVGVDGIMSDRPSLLVEVLKRKSVY